MMTFSLWWSWRFFHLQSLTLSWKCKTGGYDIMAWNWDILKICEELSLQASQPPGRRLLHGAGFGGRSLQWKVSTQVCWFDDRVGSQPVGVTDFLQSHKDAVYTVRCIQRRMVNLKLNTGGLERPVRSSSLGARTDTWSGGTSGEHLFPLALPCLGTCWAFQLLCLWNFELFTPCPETSRSQSETSWWSLTRRRLTLGRLSMSTPSPTSRPSPASSW